MPFFHEPAHHRPVGALDAEDLGAGVGVRVEVHEAYGTVRGGAGARVRLGDRVVPTEDNRERACGEHLPHRLFNGGV